jgi:hypothetical protein
MDALNDPVWNWFGLLLDDRLPMDCRNIRMLLHKIASDIYLLDM